MSIEIIPVTAQLWSRFKVHPNLLVNSILKMGICLCKDRVLFSNDDTEKEIRLRMMIEYLKYDENVPAR